MRVAVCARGEEIFALLIDVDEGLVRRAGSANEDGARDEPERFR